MRAIKFGRTIEELLPAIDEGVEQRLECYVGVATRTQRKGSADAVGVVRSIRVDIDPKEVPLEASLEALRAFEPPPSLIIKTGHGYHAYWYLTKFVPAETIVSACQHVADKLPHSDRSVTDLARVMRIAGTPNVKGPEPLECHIVEHHPERTYTLQQFGDPEAKEAYVKQVSAGGRRLAMVRHVMGMIGLSTPDIRFLDNAVVLEGMCPACADRTCTTSSNPPRPGTAFIRVADLSLACKRNKCGAGSEHAGVNEYGESRGMPYREWLDRYYPQQAQAIVELLAGRNIKAKPAPTGESLLPVDKFPNLGELDIAEAFHEVYARKLFFDVDRKTWMHWSDGEGWLVDNAAAQSRRLFMDFVRFLEHEDPRGVAAIESKGTKDVDADYLTSMRHSKSVRGIGNVLNLLSSLQGMQISTRDILSTQPALFRAQNAVINTQTGATVENTPELFQLLRGGVTFDPNATHVRWSAFLERIMPDPAEREFLQRVCGYALTAHNTEQVFFLLHGTQGANGKSTFTSVLQHVLGEYAQTAPAHTFTENPKSTNSVGDDLADLAGIRGVFLPELKAGAPLNEDLLKRFSGGDSVRVRHLYGQYFTIRPTAKVMITSNTKPSLGTGGDALWRRLVLIPFRETIPPEERIEGLAETLITEEGPGILNWCLAGAVAWHRGRLNPPASIHKAKEDYRADEDPLEAFVSMYLRADPAGSVGGRQLHIAYTTFCEKVGVRPLDLRVFNERLVCRLPGVSKGRTKHGIEWRGLVMADTEGKR